MFPKEKKNLDPKKYIVKTSAVNNEEEVNLNTTVVEPIQDLRVSNSSKNRKFESLHGRDFLIERNEVEANQDVEKVEDQWEQKRLETIERANRDATMAYRRDEGAWTDGDGYQTVREAPAFREGYNTTLRVLPPQEAHLHNGLQLLRDNDRASSILVSSARARDIVTRLISQRGDIARIVGTYFMRGLQTGFFGDKPRELELIGGLKEEIELLIRNFQVDEVPEGYTKELTETELQKRKEILANAIGNAFLEIGMTLPAGQREDPKRNDVVAINIGSRMMSNIQGQRSEMPEIHESIRKEVTIALGRIMLHLRAASDVYASRLKIPVRDALQKDRTLKRVLGQLTLQFIESSASKVGSILKRSSKKRETLIESLGNMVSEVVGQNMAPENTPQQQRVEHVNNRPLVPTKTLPAVKREYPHVEKKR